MPDLPSSIALTEIPDGAKVVAAPLRNNYAAIQTAVNAVKAALAGGSAGQLLRATDADTVAWATPLQYAVVAADGTILSSSAGVSVAHPTTGNYNVDFATPVAAGVASPTDTAPSTFAAVTTLASATRISVGITSGAAAADRAFMLLAFTV